MLTLSIFSILSYIFLMYAAVCLSCTIIGCNTDSVERIHYLLLKDDDLFLEKNLN